MSRRRWARFKRLVKGYASRIYLFPRVIVCFYTGSDNRADGLHDHPWKYRSIRLWGRLSEWVPQEHCWDTRPDAVLFNSRGTASVGAHHWRNVRLPFTYTREAEHTHAVVLESRFAATLLIHGPKERAWGFHTAEGWRWHYEVIARRKAA